MTALATTIRPFGQRFLGDEASSLRSFRANGMSPTPSPLKPSSLKARKSIFPLLRNTPRSATTATDADHSVTLNTPEQEVLLTEKVVGGARQGRGSPENTTTTPMLNKGPPSEQKPLQRPRSKSRTILRLITTKFSFRSSPSPAAAAAASPSTPLSPQRHGPPQISSAFASRESREAALRERGLLPPKASADLSRQEEEQDRQLPIVRISDDRSASSSEDAALSAANLIKKEWEAKNLNPNIDQEGPDRKSTFKFGRDSSLDAVPLPIVAELDTNIADAQQLIQSAPPLKNTPQPEPSKDLSVPPIDTSSTLPPSQMALPASPLPVFDAPPGFDPHPLSPTLIPLPSSPLPETEEAASQQDEESESRTPTPMPTASPPAIADEVEPRDKSLLNVSRDRSCSNPTQPSFSESLSSVVTPSLDTSSSLVSTLNTAESQALAPKAKTGLLKVKTHDQGVGGNIPMIVESPVEEGITGNLVESPIGKEELGVIVEESGELAPPRRGLTDPTDNNNRLPDRRKSLNPFKRGQTPDIPLNAGGPAAPVKRLSMSASLSNLRRSVVGSVTRPKSTIDVGDSKTKAFDASQLPPSPNLPKTFTTESASRSPVRKLSSRRSFEASPAVPTARPRKAVGPTLHSRGSILLETCTIEDEESRRMTELAFLG